MVGMGRVEEISKTHSCTMDVPFVRNCLSFPISSRANPVHMRWKWLKRNDKSHIPCTMYLISGLISLLDHCITVLVFIISCHFSLHFTRLLHRSLFPAAPKFFTFFLFNVYLFCKCGFALSLTFVSSSLSLFIICTFFCPLCLLVLSHRWPFVTTTFHLVMFGLFTPLTRPLWLG